MAKKIKARNIWNHGNTPVKFEEMNIGHLINCFHLLKRKAREEADRLRSLAELAPEVSDEKFCMSIYPEYDELRQEIVKRLREFPKGSIGRAYWHRKFSRPYTKMIRETTQDRPDFDNDEDDYFLHNP